MPEQATYPLGPFEQGADNRHEAYAAVFQPRQSRDEMLGPRRCVSAVNVRFNNDSWWDLRPGTTQKVAATAGLNIFVGLGMLFYQDQGVIKRVTNLSTWTTSNVVTGLNASAKVIFHEYESWILWTNGLVCGKIDSTGTYQPWSLPRPAAPTVGTTAGTLPAGRYLVSVAYVDANGVEHPASVSELETLAVAGALTVDVPAPDSEASSIIVYASKTNGEDLFYVGAAAPGAFPVTISDVSVDDSELKTQDFSPVIPGDGIFSYQGMVITFSGRYLQPSYGPAIHLYELHKTEEQRPGTIKAGGGLEHGFWVVCERGAYFTTGEVPGKWITSERKDNRRYAKGCLVLDASLVGDLDASGDVALFVSEEGLVAGTSTGQLIPLSADRLQIDVVDKTASIVYLRDSEFDQILFSLN